MADRPSPVAPSSLEPVLEDKPGTNCNPPNPNRARVSVASTTIEEISTIARQQRVPMQASNITATIGLVLLFVSFGIISMPLVDREIDAETLQDTTGYFVRKDGKYAEAKCYEDGILDRLLDGFKRNEELAAWYPQRTDTTFLNMTGKLGTEYAKGPCAILEDDGPQCILMPGHLGRVAAYGLCRNGSTFLAMQYLQLISSESVNIGSAVSSGNWQATARELMLMGIKGQPECTTIDTTTNGQSNNAESSPAKRYMLTVHPDMKDIRYISGSYNRVQKGGDTQQWHDIMQIPPAVKDTLSYLARGESEAITIPTKKRISYDGVIAEDGYGATLASKMEFVIAPDDPTNGHVHVIMYRLTAATITFPRLMFTLATALQTFLVFLMALAVSISNTPCNAFYFFQQLLRFPTLLIISIQLCYVGYYQLFSVLFLINKGTFLGVLVKKLLYVCCTSYVILQQVDVRSAVTLWIKIPNTDAYYLVRVLWMLIAISGLLIVVLNGNLSDHFTVEVDPTCPLNASECNTSKFFLLPHYFFFAALIVHPIVFTATQYLHSVMHPLEYYKSTAMSATKRPLTRFERLCTGFGLEKRYWYNTWMLVEELKAEDGVQPDVEDDDVDAPSTKVKPSYRPSTSGANRRSTIGDSIRRQCTTTDNRMRCGSLVLRDEGFVLLGGCNALVRAKDVYFILMLRYIPFAMGKAANISMTFWYVEGPNVDTVTYGRRVGYAPFIEICKRWNGRVSYPSLK